MSSTDQTSCQSIGAERFLIQQKLGSGAFGDVFRAWDQKLEVTVALKTLHRADPAAIYHFKNEFRSLADVTHPNLVQLYELQSEKERWFFTMELVEGQDFIEYAGTTAAEPSDTTQIHPLPAPVVEHDFHRLRAVLRQLAEGLCALHRAGKLHCDIKPTNLRVTSEGRLVLLDFGLAYDLSSSVFQTMVGEMRGTPAYMSPEQAVGRDVTEASDWYAVGGVLYEALTGELPFSGSVLEVLKSKQVNDGPSPRKAVPYLPDDLVELCEGLLASNPDRRPTGEQVLARLGGGWMGLPDFGEARRARHFIGRELELAILDEAFEQTQQGEAVAIFVHGASGMGKTELVGRFVDRVRQKATTPIILGGRCYERESMPFKGLDALIDNLSRYLKHLSYDQATELMPPDVQALARLFPALRRVNAVAAAPAPTLDLHDEREQKRRAKSALRALFTQLTKRSPVLLVVDDLQWGDLDSAQILADLVAAPKPPPLMLIGCYRDLGSGREPILQQLLTRPSADGPKVRELEVGELWFSEACELGLKLLGHRRAPALGLVRTIAQESGGSPFFIGELVRYVRSELGYIGGGVVDIVEDLAPSGLSLEGLIRNRLSRLPADARRLLELVAVAGRPVALETAIAAAHRAHPPQEPASGASSQLPLKLLLAGNLLRMHGTPGRELEISHDRIRETVLVALDAGHQSHLHSCLALALEDSMPIDPETLTLHHQAAGNSARAAELATVAARQALESLAFDRAIQLFKLALELLPPIRQTVPSTDRPSDGEGPPRRRLQVELGDALVHAGRRSEAGKAYLAAATASDGQEALELQRRACEQQFFGGDFVGCRQSLEIILQSIGLEVPSRSLPKVVTFAGRQLMQSFERKIRTDRGSIPHPSPTLSQSDTWRLDVLSTAWIVSSRNPFRAMDFQSRYHRLAARAGEPKHLLCALAIDAVTSAAEGSHRQERTARRLSAVHQLAERLNSKDARAKAIYAAGFAALFESRIVDASRLFDRSKHLWRQSDTDSFWLASRVSVLRACAWMLRGRLRELHASTPGMLKDLAEKGNLYDETDLRSRVAWFVHLAADQPEKATKEVHRAQALLERQITTDLWSPGGRQYLHYFHLLGRIEIALYQGQGSEAWLLLESHWNQLHRSPHFRVQLLRAEALGLRGRAAVAAATDLDDDSRAKQKLLRTALTTARRLEAEKLDWTQALASLIRIGSGVCDPADRTVERLADAEAGFQAAGFELHAAACRRRRGQHHAGGDGDALIASADSWMQRHGIRSPESMVEVLAPGRWATSSPCTKI